MTKEERIKKIDDFASIWRAIGQPSINGLFIVTGMFQGWEEFESVIGIPVLLAAWVNSGRGLPIVIAGDPEISEQFDKEANGIL